MTVYWAACLVSIVLTWFTTHVKHDYEREGVLYWLAVTFVSALPLIYIAAIRYDVGADYMAYYRYYENVLGGEGQGRYEILYYLVNQIIAAFQGSAPWVFGATAAIFLMPVYKRIICDSPYPSLSVFLLLGMTYYFFFLNGMRQMMAAAFLLYSLQYVERRRPVPFAVCVLIATGFHTTSIVFLAFYLLAWLDLSPRKLCIISVIVAASAAVIGTILTSILSRMEYYSEYLETAFAQQGQGYIVLLMNILIVAFSTFFYQEDNPRYRIYYNVQIVALWAALLTGQVVLIDRYRMMFGLAAVILVPMTLDGIENDNTRRISFAGIVLLYYIYAAYTVGVQNSNTVLPYQTIFSALV